MAQVTVTSGWHPAGYSLYGRNFADGFAKFWPAAYGLAVYTEEPVTLPKGECRSLWDCPGVAEFIARHKNNPEACGKKANKLWRPKHIGRDYNFRFDAVKFCKQLFIPAHAASRAGADDIIVWLDGDVKTDAKVPDAFVEGVIGEADLVYLGRNGYHSELGFWACRNNERGRLFMNGLASCFITDAVFKLSEWHSAWVFDHVRAAQSARKRDPLRALNLTPNGAGHVWMQSPLRAFSDHLKGVRKAIGSSPERKRA
jgi:hypothetical protein